MNQVLMLSPKLSVSSVVSFHNTRDLQPDTSKVNRLLRPLVAVAWWLIRRTVNIIEFPLRKEDWSAQTVHFDPDNFIEQMQLSATDLLRVWNKDAKYLVCGPSAFRDLDMCAFNKLPPFMFKANARLGDRGFQKVCGIKVVMIPWMQGAVLLPDLESV